MEEQATGLHSGIVTSLNGDLATVRFVRSSMCKHCGACLAVGDKELEMQIDNSLHAQIGDRVAVELAPRKVVQASLLAYLIPLVLLLAGVFLGSLINDWMGLVCGIAGCLLAFGILRLLERKRKEKNAFHPSMTALLQPHEEANDLQCF